MGFASQISAFLFANEVTNSLLTEISPPLYKKSLSTNFTYIVHENGLPS